MAALSGAKGRHWWISRRLHAGSENCRDNFGLLSGAAVSDTVMVVALNVQHQTSKLDPDEVERPYSVLHPLGGQAVYNVRCQRQ